MKTTQFISRVIASLLLGVILHSHVCAALCASGIYSCCVESKELPDCCKKSCCDKEGGSSKDSGCQQEHLALFGTFGQFHFGKTNETKIFHPVVYVINNEKSIQSVISEELYFAFNGFHLPPPKENIIILTQQFLI